MNKTNNKRQRTTANDHLDGPASCKWSSRRTILLQMIIAIDHPLAIDHLYWMTSWEWSSGWTGLSQMIIQMDRPHANNHPDWLAACKGGGEGGMNRRSWEITRRWCRGGTTPARTTAEWKSNWQPGSCPPSPSPSTNSVQLKKQPFLGVFF